VSWFGLETDTLSPHGLWARNYQEILDQVVKLGYNSIRLPFSNELFNDNLKPQGVDFSLNPDLKGLNGLQIMDKIIVAAGERGLKILLDQHRASTDGQSKLWYTDELPESQWIADWVALARRYKGNDTIIGADLHNEPARDTTWGTDDPLTDWRLAAERAGNAILDVNPDWLIVVEGIEKTEDDFGNILGWYWMGGALQYARAFPVRLKIANRLVYSAHDYGPGVYLQGWFMDEKYPNNLPEVWDHHWGYIVKEGIAPLLLGEFGGKSVGDDIEGVWQRSLVKYLKENGIGYTYWSLNGNSGDTGGLLKEDWRSYDEAKQQLLAGYQDRLLGNASPKTINADAVPGPRPQMLYALKGLQKDLPEDKWVKVLQPQVYVANKTTQPMNIAGLEARYWFAPGAGSADPKDQVVEVKGVVIGDKDFGASQVKAEILREENPGQTLTPLLYVKLTFGSGVTVPARDAIGVKLNISNKAGGAFFQEAGYSYRHYGWQTEWDRIGLYKDGKLVWGLEPKTWYAEEKMKLEAKLKKAQDLLTKR